MGDNSTADTFFVFDEADEFPSFVLFDLAVGFVAADLFIQGVEELLSRGGSGISGAVLEGAPETTETEKTLGGAVEGNAHSV